VKQVDFYLISNSVKFGRFKLASRLANKLQKMGKSLLLVTNSAKETEELDTLMWSYGDTSFVAHETIHSITAEDESQAISSIHLAEHQSVNSAVLDRNYDVLLNLCDEVPVFNHHFDRIAEIIEADESSKAAGRGRYKHYKSEGFELLMHDISL